MRPLPIRRTPDPIDVGPAQGRDVMSSRHSSVGRRFDARLTECRFCTAYLAQMRATIAELGKVDERTISPTRRLELLNAFRDLGG